MFVHQDLSTIGPIPVTKETELTYYQLSGSDSYPKTCL